MNSKETPDQREQIDHLRAIKKTVRRNFQDMVNLLTSVIGLSSPYLGCHLQRVAEGSKALADLLEYTKEDSYTIYYAGLLHDIGLIGEPESYLTAPSNTSFDEKQREAFLRHPQTGEEISSTVYDFRRIGVIIRGHHESYDGRGFPDGLAGEKIPKGARIIRIVNDYDRLLYVDNCSISEALDILFTKGGQDYDPEMLERFGNYIRRLGLAQMTVETTVALTDLQEGQFLFEDIYLKNGMLLLPKGVVLNDTKIQKIHALIPLAGGRQKVQILQAP